MNALHESDAWLALLAFAAGIVFAAALRVWL